MNLLLGLITTSVLLSQAEVIVLAGINTLGILLLPDLAPRIFPDLGGKRSGAGRHFLFYASKNAS